VEIQGNETCKVISGYMIECKLPSTSNTFGEFLVSLIDPTTDVTVSDQSGMHIVLFLPEPAFTKVTPELFAV
jgi:hypothetical protein